jgi:Fe-S-cluster-containing hydrogenase component 2
MTDLFNKINYCYGCGVCVIACPRNAISMIMSDEGFYIPVLKDERSVSPVNYAKMFALILIKMIF